MITARGFRSAANDRAGPGRVSSRYPQSPRSIRKKDKRAALGRSLMNRSILRIIPEVLHLAEAEMRERNQAANEQLEQLLESG